MSAVSTALNNGPRVNSTDPFSAITSEKFLEIMFTELTNQDPLSPNETKDLLEQMSTLRSIQSDVSFSQKIEDLVKQNEVTSASSLIGKLVTGLTESGQRTIGLVDSISVTRNGAVLNLSNGTRLAFENVDEVIDPDLLPDGADDPTPTDGPDPTDGDDDDEGGPIPGPEGDPGDPPTGGEPPESP